MRATPFLLWDSCPQLVRHPSLSEDYGNALCMEDLEQHLMWLGRPIREWQLLPHWRQIQSVPCPAPRFCCFRDCPFASACWTSVSSKWERLWSTTCLQTECADVKVSHLLRSIPKPSDPTCRYPCIAAVVSLWGVFHALIRHTGDLLESDRQPFSWHAQANIDIAVSVIYTC